MPYLPGERNMKQKISFKNMPKVQLKKIREAQTREDQTPNQEAALPNIRERQT
jgi:hypothetical protein